MTWFVASLHDEDTHLNENSTGATVTARCGPSFRPLAGLVGSPPDQLHAVKRACSLARGGFSQDEWERRIPDLPYQDTCPA
jgi:hypothetical protein